MSYYMGDYYMGDPGIGSSLARLARAGVGALVRRSPIGMAVGAVAGVAGGLGLTLPQFPRLPVPGGRISLPALPKGGTPFFQPGKCDRAGFHLNKARVYARAAASKESYCVKNRSLNPANPRALRRAIRREKSFVGLARRVLRGTGMKISRRGMGSGKRGRKRSK